MLIHTWCYHKPNNDVGVPSHQSVSNYDVAIHNNMTAHYYVINFGSHASSGRDGRIRVGGVH